MKCPCGVNHWLHVAAGLQGIVGMMVVLEAGNVPADSEALEKLESELARLQELAKRQRIGGSRE